MMSSRAFTAIKRRESTRKSPGREARSSILPSFTGVGDIHFIYSSDEVLHGALPDFEAACDRAGVPHTAFARPGMVHCYCMLPYFKEAREDFARITEILSK